MLGTSVSYKDDKNSKSPSDNVTTPNFFPSVTQGMCSTPKSKVLQEMSKRKKKDGEQRKFRFNRMVNSGMIKRIVHQVK